MSKLEFKWIIGLPNRIGPVNESVRLIPRTFPDDDDWYFVRSEKIAVPASRVFDSPRAAANGAIQANERQIRTLTLENERLRDWHDSIDPVLVPKETSAA